MFSRSKQIRTNQAIPRMINKYRVIHFDSMEKYKLLGFRNQCLIANYTVTLKTKIAK